MIDPIFDGHPNAALVIRTMQVLSAEGAEPSTEQIAEKAGLPLTEVYAELFWCEAQGLVEGIRESFGSAH